MPLAILGLVHLGKQRVAADNHRSADCMVHDTQMEVRMWPACSRSRVEGSLDNVKALQKGFAVEAISYWVQDLEGATEAAVRQWGCCHHLVPGARAAAGGSALHSRCGCMGSWLHLCGALDTAAPISGQRGQGPQQCVPGMLFSSCMLDMHRYRRMALKSSEGCMVACHLVCAQF